MTAKLTIGYIRGEFEKRGWSLITSQYLGNQQQLEAVCPKGHKTYITWNNFKNKGDDKGCKYCSGKVTHTYEFVKSKFEEAGYQLLSTEYKRNDIPLEFICDKGHRDSIRFGDFYNSGSRCNQCKGEKLSKAFRESDESIIDFCKSINFEFVKSEVRKGKTYIFYKCSNGHVAEAYFTNLKRHQSCWECSKLKKSGDKCYRWNPDRQYIKTIRKFRKTSERLVKRVFKATNQKKADKSAAILGYNSIELKNHIENHPNMASLQGKSYHIDHIYPIKAFFDYKIKNIKLINCLENLQPLEGDDNLNKAGNYDMKAFEEWLTNKGVIFKSKVLESEKFTTEIYSWLLSSGIIANIKDSVIITAKTAIKYVGCFTLEDKQNVGDYLKCKNSGLKLITIFFDEWNQRKDQCKNFLKSVLGLNETIYARNCIVKEINADVGRNFIKTYHIQGSNKLGIAFWGLFYNDDLVGVISLGRHNRQVEDGSIVLDRLCFKDGYQILGGASKLFLRCVEYARDNKYSKIISFSDNRWSSGGIYEKLNFILEREYDADYSYISLNGDVPRRLSKQSQRKKVVKCPTNFTEYEWAKKRGLTRIYDCGKKKWVFNLEKEKQNDSVENDVSTAQVVE